MNKLETRTIIENSGNYEEYEIDDVMEVFDALSKHIGWEDKRRDKRFIVKFPDIFWYMDEEWEREHEKEFDRMFEDFCELQYEFVKQELQERDAYFEKLLSNNYVGHYQAFSYDIEEITNENIAELTMNIYDEEGGYAQKYVEDYIFVVNTLKDLEDNYVEFWFDFLEEEDFPKDKLKEMREKYKKDQEEKGK